MTPRRIYKWDNAKALLMFLVVLGHFTEPFTEAGYPLIYRSIFMILYTFHMPAFIFISGMFSKSTLQKESFAFAKLFPFDYLIFHTENRVYGQRLYRYTKIIGVSSFPIFQYRLVFVGTVRVLCYYVFGKTHKPEGGTHCCHHPCVPRGVW